MAEVAQAQTMPETPENASLTLQQRVGLQVRQLRRERGWSQDTLAHLTHMHRSYPNQIEKGKVDLRLSTLEKLAQVFEMTPADLLSGAAEESRS